MQNTLLTTSSEKVSHIELINFFENCCTVYQNGCSTSNWLCDSVCHNHHIKYSLTGYKERLKYWTLENKNSIFHWSLFQCWLR